jgi:hypothetical protein
MTFVEAAGVHSNPATSARALGNARKALAEIQRCLKNPAAHGLSEDEVVFLEKRCTKIESALVVAIKR